ncbi:hypothetical protein [Clostridium sp. JNZ J1-5]
MRIGEALSFMYLTKRKEGIVICIVVEIIISIFVFFICSDFLQKETEKAIEKSYNKISKHDKDYFEKKINRSIYDVLPNVKENTFA